MQGSFSGSFAMPGTREVMFATARHGSTGHRTACARVAARSPDAPSPALLWLCALFLLCALPAGAWAQAVSVMGGIDYSSSSGEEKPAYQVAYSQRMTNRVIASVSYLNEGHFQDHHPDGYGLDLQYAVPLTLWDHSSTTLFVGGGLFYYFDTLSRPGAGSVDTHGVAPELGATLRGHVRGPWYWIAGAGVVASGREPRIAVVGAGLSYRLWSDPDYPERELEGLFEEPFDSGDGSAHDFNEISLYGARSVINIKGNPGGLGASAELRHHFDWASPRDIEGTVSYIHEGDPQVARRRGLTLQLWPVRTDLLSKSEIGVGIGVYAYLDVARPTGLARVPTAALAPVVSVMISHPITGRWFVRGIWDRVVTNYNRDADILRVGIGRAF